jgi:Rrf2 family iron-sulfur cluster assembly transcriptional regulator
MRLTTKGRYGVRAVVNLAAAADDRPISISQIAGQENLSPEFLEQIFFKLKKAGLIRSVRGPKGGFMLNRPPADITIKTILDAVGEPLSPTPCADGAVPPCPRQDDCAIAPVWQEFYGVMERHLEGISLEDILTGKSNKETAELLSGK